MIKKVLIILFRLGLSFFFLPCLNAHDYQVSLIADTDMALDDVRTLVMLLNSDMTDIRLIVSSDGAVSPQKGCENIRRLLNSFNRKDIPVAVGRTSDKPAPLWRSWSENLNIPDSESDSNPSEPFIPATEAILKALEQC